MLALFRNEFRTGLKALLIWAIAVGGMGLFCILLYQSMEGSMEEMAESMASMGSFSDAFGMSTLSLATLKGYFATEIGTIHALGGSLFAASVATVAFSKEEDAHTAEFTFTLPLTRGKIIVAKLLQLLATLILFHLLCAGFYLLGFRLLGETDMGSEFIEFMFLQFVTSVEIAAFCVGISVTSKRNRLGLGIAIAMFFYTFDLLARVIPKLSDVMFLSPFSYSNATAIFVGADTDWRAIFLALFCIVGFIVASAIYYTRKDLAS